MRPGTQKERVAIAMPLADGIGPSQEFRSGQGLISKFKTQRNAL